MNYGQFARGLALAVLYVVPAMTHAQDMAKGRLVYQTTCAGCHTSGLAGAPKLGDAAAWARRVEGGAAALYTSATKGKGAMPPKGGNASLSDADLRAAVDFISKPASAGKN